MTNVTPVNPEKVVPPSTPATAQRPSPTLSSFVGGERPPSLQLLPAMDTSSDHSASSVPDEDHVRTVYAGFKVMYQEMFAYVNGGRQARLNECEAIQQRIQQVDSSLQFLPPEAVGSIRQMLAQEYLRLENIKEDV